MHRLLILHFTKSGDETEEKQENRLDYEKDKIEKAYDKSNKVGSWIDDKLEERINDFTDAIFVHFFFVFFSDFLFL